MDLYDIYDKLFPDMSEEEFHKLPSPISILQEADWDSDCACRFPVVYLNKDGPIHTVVINVQSTGSSTTLIKITDSYNSEWGYSYNPEVTIVEAVEVQRTVIEYRAKQ